MCTFYGLLEITNAFIHRRRTGSEVQCEYQLCQGVSPDATAHSAIHGGTRKLTKRDFIFRTETSFELSFFLSSSKLRKAQILWSIK